MVSDRYGIEAIEADRSVPNVVARQLACDPCRKRKVRCDKLSPCSNCNSSNIVCQTTKERSKRRQKDPKSRFEQSIIDLNKKIEHLSQHLRPSSEVPVTPTFVAERSPRSPSISDYDVSYIRQKSPQEQHSGSNFEGQSSFFTHSKQATRAFQDSLVSTPRAQDDEAIAGAINKLHNVLNHSNSQAVIPLQMATSSHESDYRALSALPMPPNNAVIRLLRHVKVHSCGYLKELPFINISAITEYCQKVYFATEPYSIAIFIIVNTCLVFLLRELNENARKDIEVQCDEVANYLSFLPKNIDMALRRFSLTTPQTLDNIKAIVLASTLATESVIYSSDWDLLSNAARMALNAGLHRLEKIQDDAENQTKRLLFWHIYSMDRALALNHGIAPNIPDYDIQTEKPSLPDDIDGHMGHIHMHWIDLSELQGQIYVQLYSAQAEREPLEAKVDSARQLAIHCLEIQESLHMATKGVEGMDEDSYFALRGMDIIFQNLLTMVYRVIPPADSGHPLQFNYDCIRTARIALTLHNNAWPEFAAHGNDTWRSFIHWSTLFSPFLPFIAIFGNVIARSDLGDLALLEAFVTTLKTVAEISPVVKKVLNACSNFLQIAKIYVATKNKQVTLLDTAAEDAITDPQALDRPHEMNLEPLPQFSWSQQDWDLMLSEWDLGLGAEDARQMSSYLDMLPNNSTQ